MSTEAIFLADEKPYSCTVWNAVARTRWQPVWALTRSRMRFAAHLKLADARAAEDAVRGCTAPMREGHAALCCAIRTAALP
jgi:hypothetical protein